MMLNSVPNCRTTEGACIQPSLTPWRCPVAAQTVGNSCLSPLGTRNTPLPAAAPTESPMTDLLAETDRCVKCGMCLPHCPTYTVTRHEADSPRGRIALAQGMASGGLAPSAAAARHLQGCLGCRACESVCPSGVRYGRIIDAARTELRRHSGPTAGERALAPLIDRLLRSRSLRRSLGRTLTAYRKTRLQAMIRGLRLLAPAATLRRAEALLPEHGPYHPALARHYPAAQARYRVALFTGCVAELADAQTLRSAQRLLSRLGVEVTVPLQQVCCGALDQHGGRPEKARRLAETNLSAFTPDDVDAVVTTASGCGAQLAEYPEIVADSEAFAARVEDLSTFILSRGLLDPERLQPQHARVALHTPCTLRHVLRQTTAPAELLRQIPGAELHELTDAGCCGAAGTHLLTQPGMADRLVEPKVAEIETVGADILVTSNVGCALHLRAALRRRGLTTEVLHPATLLERAHEQADT